MKKVILYMLFFYTSIVFVSIVSCRKTDMRQDIEVAQVDNSNEVTEEDFEEIDNSPDYDTEVTPTKVTKIEGLQVADTSGYADCTKFKYKGFYEAPFYPYSGNTLTITLSKGDTIDAILTDFPDLVKFDSLQTISPTQVKVKMHAAFDTLKTKKVTLVLRSLNNVTSAKTKLLIKVKIQAIGLINKKPYGSPFWEVRRFRKSNGTFLQPLNTFVEITNSYIPQYGDVLYWTTNYLGSIVTEPKVTVKAATKKEVAHTLYEFSVSEMNAKCTQKRSIKKIKMKSYDVENTLISADIDRGNPTHYYRSE
jgi:hypothetical protein